MDEENKKQSDEGCDHDDENAENKQSNPTTTTTTTTTTTSLPVHPSSNSNESSEEKKDNVALGYTMMGPGAFPMSGGDDDDDEEEDEEFDGDDLSQGDMSLVQEIQKSQEMSAIKADAARVPNTRQLTIAPKAPGDNNNNNNQVATSTAAAAVAQIRRLQSKTDTSFGSGGGGGGAEEQTKGTPQTKKDIENQQKQQQQQQQEAMIEAEIAPDIDEVVQDAVRKAVQEALNAKELEEGGGGGSGADSPSRRLTHHSNGVPREVILAEKMDDDLLYNRTTICGLPKVWFIFLVILVVAGIVVAILFAAGAFSSLSSSSKEDTAIQANDPYNQFVSLMDLLYPGLPFEDFTDGQYSAARWITESDPRNLDTTVLTPELMERFALATLYFSTGGDYWNDPASSHQWLSNLPHCAWDFVDCEQEEGSSSPSVLSIDLRSQGLAGTLPVDIKFLTSLTSLDIARNHLDGFSLSTEIFLSLTNLVHLNFQRSKFVGSIPTEIGRLSALETLRLGWNSFEGSVPTELGNLSKLTYLEAQWNRLTGPIPTEFGRLSQLVTFRIRMNQLTGALPSELGEITAMTDFSLMGNQLSQRVPSSLNNWKDIEKFYIQQNNLSGGLDSLFCNATSTLQIFKADCYLNCTCCTECD